MAAGVAQALILRCGSGQYVGFAETRRGLHSYSVCAAGSSSSWASSSIDASTLALDDDLTELLGPVKSKKWFTDRLWGSCGDAETFARALQRVVFELADQQAEGSSWVGGASAQHKWSRVQLLVESLGQIGWQHVVATNPELSALTLRLWDSAKREHIFELAVPDNYPYAAPVVRIALPAPIELPWPHRGVPGDLRIVMDTVQRALLQHEALFAALEDIDTHCWVLEPLQPTFASTARRIAIEKTCSVVVELRPDDPFGICSMRLLGPPARTAQLQAHLALNVQRWSQALSVRQNLAAVLGVELPQRAANNNSKGGGDGDGFLVECGICYSYALASADAGMGGGGGGGGDSIQIPDQACPHSRCGKVYHNSCLSTWLQSVPSSRTSFGTTFGTCPFCGEWLSTKSGLQ